MYTVTIDPSGARSIIAHYETVNEASDRFGREVERLQNARGGMVALYERTDNLPNLLDRRII